MTYAPDETTPADDTESKLLAYARMVKQGVITPKQYQEIKASLVGDEEGFSDPDLSVNLTTTTSSMRSHSHRQVLHSPPETAALMYA